MIRKRLISLDIDTGGYREFVDQILNMSLTRNSNYVCVANVHMLVESYKDKSFATEVNDADLVTPDGMPLSWSIRLLYGNRQDRVAGMDLLPDLLTQCAQRKISVFFYGATNPVLEQANHILKSRYPGLSIAGSYSPPFRQLTEQEEELVVEDINASGANIVFVILGCPKQEKWMAKMKGRINATMIGIGGALPVLIGLQQRAPKWMQRSGFEWAYRLLQEPKRLFKRYFVTNSLFSYLILREFISSRLMRRTIL